MLIDVTGSNPFSPWSPERIKLYNACLDFFKFSSIVAVLEFEVLMKFHKHMRDMRDLLRFKAYFQFNVTF